MQALIQGIKRFVRDEEGVTMVEYGLLAALIAVVCVTVIATIGRSLRDDVFQKIADCLATPATC